MFIDLLYERMAMEAGTPVTLVIDVHGDHLEITPEREGTGVVVQGNEVLIGGRRLVLRLAGPASGVSELPQ